MRVEPGETYITPTGRACRLVPYADTSPAVRRVFLFEYLDAAPAGARARMGGEREQFTMSASNLYLLRLEARSAAAR